MPHPKKRVKSEVNIPNYSMYEFADTMPTFVEADQVPEKDLHELKCYGSYQLQAPLNHFSDTMLNDHLYTMYKKGKLETHAKIAVLLLKEISQNISTKGE